MEQRFWDWLCKGFDGLVAMIDHQAQNEGKIPEAAFASLTNTFGRFKNLINRELEKRGRAPME